MNAVSCVSQTLARRLIAAEVSCDASLPPTHAALRAAEKLRGPLVKLAGVAGFHSLLTRAVALATYEMPELRRVKVETDGTLTGLETIPSQKVPRAGGDCGERILTHLLGLLMTFIGVSLTMRLVNDVWPNLPPGEPHSKAEGPS